ncbi:MAG: A/G-specific adenine glycosylase [Thermoplasmatota archaeon]
MGAATPRSATCAPAAPQIQADDRRPPRGPVDLSQKLLDWYRTNARTFPWRRREATPWPTLVSEIMLQQTRASVVAARYEAFMARYPDPSTFANASAGEVAKAWEGLGYYRRARALQEAARAIANDAWPQTAQGLERLPGVGRYTARAIASIVYGERVLAVDGNVDRVLSRVHLLDEANPAHRRASIEGMTFVPSQAGDFLQALFDLGNLVCLPKAPRCAACPLVKACAAHGAGRAASVPPRKVRPRPTALHVAAAWVVDDAGTRVLLEPSGGGFLSGLWNPPYVEQADPRAARAALAARFELVGRPLRYDHTFTHKRWSVSLYHARIAITRMSRPANKRSQVEHFDAASPSRGRWHDLADLPAMASAWKPSMRWHTLAAQGPGRTAAHRRARRGA